MVENTLEAKGGIEDEVIIGGMAIPRVEKLRYLGLIIPENGILMKTLNNNKSRMAKIEEHFRGVVR